MNPSADDYAGSLVDVTKGNQVLIGLTLRQNATLIYWWTKYLQDPFDPIVRREFTRAVTGFQPTHRASTGRLEKFRKLTSKSRWLGPFMAGVTFADSAYGQWQEDSNNSNLNLREKLQRATIRGGMVAGGSSVLASAAARLTTPLAVASCAEALCSGLLVAIPVTAGAGYAGGEGGDIVADEVFQRGPKWLVGE
ncbi:hypothetical protein AERO9AM_10001 [Aeromicrobium sp. 9AM]|nr:hypothetical protein AERO9AM_10001 [Aeromicrobium sp. 9AM]